MWGIRGVESGTEFVEKVRLEQKIWRLEGQRSTGPRLGATLRGGWFLSLLKKI